MLISTTDQLLLDKHQVKIEIDAKDESGIIVIQDRRFKVTLLTRPSGKNQAAWKATRLEEEHMRETASKVAVMLLKKELLQTQPQSQLLKFSIHQKGITNLTNQKVISHEDTHVKKNTRSDYSDLMNYLADVSDQDIVEDEEEEENEEVDVQIGVQEKKIPSPQPIILNSNEKDKTLASKSQIPAKSPAKKKKSFFPKTPVDAKPPSKDSQPLDSAEQRRKLKEQAKEDKKSS